MSVVSKFKYSVISTVMIVAIGLVFLTQAGSAQASSDYPTADTDQQVCQDANGPIPCPPADGQQPGGDEQGRPPRPNGPPPADGQQPGGDEQGRPPRPDGPPPADGQQPGGDEQGRPPRPDGPPPADGQQPGGEPTQTPTPDNAPA